MANLSPAALTAPSDRAFNPPPTWNAPTGLDPRLGHPLDPAWPDPPVGWELWTARQRPARTLHSRLESVGVARLLLAVVGLVVLALFVIHAVSGSSGTSDGVGSCWTNDGGGSYATVSCSSDRGTRRATAEVSTPDLCPATADDGGYLVDSTDASKVLCLAVITHY